MTDRLIRITTALAVVAVASVAAIISCQHAFELVTTDGETGLTARLLPFTVDGLIWAASLVVLDASRRNHSLNLARFDDHPVRQNGATSGLTLLGLGYRGAADAAIRCFSTTNWQILPGLMRVSRNI